ncbi:hypothetical protein GGU11DRAFT_644743, partial [Lentinula aff. detonsa]
FGDPLAERLEYILTQHAPFPGEPVNSEEFRSMECFVAYHISDHAHLLIDSAYEDREYQIPMSTLMNPDFEPSSWFAGLLRNSEVAGNKTSQPMGDARATRVSQILNGAAHYPGDELPDFHPRRNEY